MSVHQRLTDAQREEFVAMLIEFKRTNPAEYELVLEAMVFVHDAQTGTDAGLAGHRAARARRLVRRIRASFAQGDTAEVVGLLHAARRAA